MRVVGLLRSGRAPLLSGCAFPRGIRASPAFPRPLCDPRLCASLISPSGERGKTYAVSPATTSEHASAAPQSAPTTRPHESEEPPRTRMHAAGQSSTIACVGSAGVGLCVGCVREERAREEGRVCGMCVREEARGGRKREK